MHEDTPMALIDIVREPFMDRIPSLRKRLEENQNFYDLHYHVTDLLKGTAYKSQETKKIWPSLISAMATIYDNEVHIAGERLYIGLELLQSIHFNCAKVDTWTTLMNILSNTPPWFKIHNREDYLRSMFGELSSLNESWPNKVIGLPAGWHAFYMQYGACRNVDPEGFYHTIMLSSGGD